MRLLICLAFVGLCAGQGDFARDIFEKTVDTNKNKLVDPPEFLAIFLQDDLNKDDQVPLAEYLNATGAVGKGPTTFFNLLDPNKDGVILKTELPAILHNFDLDGDGKVTEAEFLKYYGDIYSKAFNLPVSVGK